MSKDLTIAADTARVLSNPLSLPKPNSSSANFTTAKPNTTETLVGFNATFLQFANDAGITPATGKTGREMAMRSIKSSPKLTKVNLQSQDGMRFDPVTSPKKFNENRSLVELRNYTGQMDNFSSHTFNIYGGKAVKNSPEFMSYQKEYASNFGAISVLIHRLEDILNEHGVKHAVINGHILHELALLNAPHITKDQLFASVLNLEQIQPTMNKVTMTGNNIRVRATTRIQTYVRMRRARREYIILRKQIGCAVKLQALFRSTIQKIRAVSKYKIQRGLAERNMKKNQYLLKNTWTNIPKGKRLLIHIPSVSCDEYIRLSMSNISVLHNAHISSLWQLVHPDVHIIYISPIYFSNEIVEYYEKFLSMIGISVFPRRFHFLVPEAQGLFPAHMSLTQTLWYSPVTLNKIKYIMKSFNEVCIIPTGLSFVEKRLAFCLDCPLLGPNPSRGEMLRSRSFVKRVFMDCCVNLPVGAHDVTNEEDFIVALCRLITSNLDVERWGFRLNTDYNNESYAYLEPLSLSIMKNLRTEREMLIRTNHNNAAVWFAHPVQLSARKRLMPVLIAEVASKVKITHPHIYASWKAYVEKMSESGAVMEAEPKVINFVDAMCFITPSGETESIVGVNGYANDRLQMHSYAYPQCSVPASDITEVMTVIAARIHADFDIIGYVTVRFTSYCDSKDGVMRLFGHSIYLGLTPVFGAVGTAGILGGVNQELPSSMYPEIPKGRCFLYVPLAYHPPMRGTRDDIFFRLAKMHRVVFDIENKTGALFFMLDSIMGGAVSILCIGPSRRKVLDYAIHALNFINQQFGKDNSALNDRPWENLTDILHDLKVEAKKEKRGR